MISICFLSYYIKTVERIELAKVFSISIISMWKFDNCLGEDISLSYSLDIFPFSLNSLRLGNTYLCIVLTERIPR